MQTIQKNNTEQNNQILQHCLNRGLDHLLYTLHSALLWAFKQIQEKITMYKNKLICYSATHHDNENKTNT